MASANVLQLTSQVRPVSANAKVVKSSGAGRTGSSASFTSFLQETAGSATGAKDSAKELSINRSGETDTFSQRRITTAERKTAAEKVSEASETVKESGEELRGIVEEKLGLDEEELESAMSLLGLGTFDLLNPQNLAQLILQISGGESEAEVLLDPQFAELMQEISGLEQDLMDQMGVSAGEMGEVLAQLELLEQPTQMEEPLQPEQSVEMDPTTKTAGMEAAAPLENRQNVQEHMETEIEEDLPSSEFSDEVQLNQESGDAGESGNDGSQGGNAMEMPSRGSGEKGTKEVPVRQEGNPQSTVTYTQSLETQAVADMPASENADSSVDPLDVIRQIAEHVKVSITQENSSMEMQLNPENLGRIYLQVSAKEGSVHATIAAQNEAVRAALESQVAELKESLNQAGVKVDAVEVTVASHEFEKNLEQNERQQQNEGERQQEQISRRKGSGVTLLGDSEEFLSEEEALAARIMQDNGNSVDYTA